MADIIGTNGKDLLEGTSESDNILSLEGNDRIIASDGSDVIDGGAGKDVVDYSNFDGLGVELFFDPGINISKKYDEIGNSINDRIVGIETIIGNPNKTNRISAYQLSGTTTQNDIVLDVDLSINRLTYSSQFMGNKTLNIENFKNVQGGNGNDRLKGNNLDNFIDGRLGNDTIIGSKGNDILFGNSQGIDTLDYSNLDRTIKFSGFWNIVGGKSGTFISSLLKIDKGNFGIDTIYYPNKIIGAPNKENTIDVSTTIDPRISLDINLATNSMEIKSSGARNGEGFPSYLGEPQKYEIVNFVNVIGTKGDDTIVGANKNSKLTGGGGSDTIRGGTKNDRLTGTDSTAKGVGEVDTLTGGGGKNKFVLGDKNGAYYIGNGSNDYATITDFNIFQDSINLGGSKNYSFALAANNTIDLFSGKDINNRDLIAKIQISGGISSVASNSRSVMGASPNLDSIISKIDVLSGSESGQDS